MSDKNAASDTAGVEKVAAKALAGPRKATFSDLTKKPRRTLTFTVLTQDEDGDVQLEMKYKAISAKEYDDLVAAHPPKPKDKQSGASFDLDTFAPALIAAMSVDPKLTEDEAKEIWDSPEWSGGEVSTLFFNAQRVCNAGLDVPFNDRG